MKILQTVVVKQVLTEKSKKDLLEKFEKKIFQLQKECDQLQFEQKKLEKNNKFTAIHVRNQFESEIRLRQEKIKSYDYQIKQLQFLPLGSELKEREVQGVFEVQIGDSWDEKWNRSEIVIRDGIILEIR